jgi:hypothetical protein
MKPINFPGRNNVILIEDQPLPCHVGRADECRVTSCWLLSWRERLLIFFTGKLWWQQLTFFEPLQPQRPSVLRPPATDDPDVMTRWNRLVRWGMLKFGGESNG